jgi:hypothetical protein
MQLTTEEASAPSCSRMLARFCSITRVCSAIDPPTGVPFKMGPWPARNASLPPAKTASKNGAPANRAAGDHRLRPGAPVARRC